MCPRVLLLAPQGNASLGRSDDTSLAAPANKHEAETTMKNITFTAEDSLIEAAR